MKNSQSWSCKLLNISMNRQRKRDRRAEEALPLGRKNGRKKREKSEKEEGRNERERRERWRKRV